MDVSWLWEMLGLLVLGIAAVLLVAQFGDDSSVARWLSVLLPILIAILLIHVNRPQSGRPSGL